MELDSMNLSRTLDSRDSLSTASKTENSPPCAEEESPSTTLGKQPQGGCNENDKALVVLTNLRHAPFTVKLSPTAKRYSA